METAFGILLFLLVYGAVTYVIYQEVTGKRSGLRRWRARRARLRATARAGSMAASPTPAMDVSAPSR
jgi:hypothetical protein